MYQHLFFGHTCYLGYAAQALLRALGGCPDFCTSVVDPGSAVLRFHRYMMEEGIAVLGGDPFGGLLPRGGDIAVTPDVPGWCLVKQPSGLVFIAGCAVAQAGVFVPLSL